MNASEQQRLANVKARFIDTIASVRQRQLAGGLPMTEQANPANIKALVASAKALRSRA